MTKPVIPPSIEESVFQTLLTSASLRLIMHMRDHNEFKVKSKLCLYCRINNEVMTRLLKLYNELGMIKHSKEGRDTMHKLDVTAPFTRKYLQLIDGAWDIVNYQMGKRLRGSKNG